MELLLIVLPFAAVLLTLLFWFSVFGISLTEGLVNHFRTQAQVQIEEANEDIAGLDSRIEMMGPDEERLRASLEMRRQTRIDVRDGYVSSVERLDRWYRPVRVMQAILPKTSETIALLDRWLKRDSDVDFMDILNGNIERDEEGEFRPRTNNLDREVRVQRLPDHAHAALPELLDQAVVSQGSAGFERQRAETSGPRF